MAETIYVNVSIRKPVVNLAAAKTFANQVKTWAAANPDAEVAANVSSQVEFD